MTKGFRLAATIAIALDVFFSPCVRGQEFESPTQQKNTLNAEVWSAPAPAFVFSSAQTAYGFELDPIISQVGTASDTAAKGSTPADGSVQQIVDPSPAGTQVSQAFSRMNDSAPGITGTPGLFSVETAEVLPKGAIVASAYMDRFSRAPGSVSILSGGLTVSTGITKRITLLAQFEPYRHLYVAEPSQLSLNFPAGCPHDVFKAPIYCAVPVPPNPGPETPPQSSWKGPAAAYVPGFPFAARNMSDYGPVALGVKVNFWSETRNDPLSVSFGAEVAIPTESAAAELAKRGAQTGAFDYLFILGLSKTLRHGIVLANNVTYVLTGDPKANGETLLTPGDFVIFKQGFIFPIRHHLQFLTEYSALFPQEGHVFGVVGIDTENTYRGPSVPVDGIWGVRWNFRDGTAVDLGYRYMLNLHQINNRSGFIVQISNFFRRPKSE